MESTDDPWSKKVTSLALLHSNQQQLLFHTQFFITTFVKQLPVPESLKLKLFQAYSYFTILHFSPFQILIFVVFGQFFILFMFLILIRLVKKLLHIFFPFIWTKLLDKPQDSTFLEVTFPKDTNKSAYATEQLYLLLHKLAQPKNYLALYIKRKITFSLEVVSSKERGIRYLIVVPTDTKEILKRNLLSYLPGVNITEVADYLPSHMGFTQRQKPTKEYCKKVTIEELKFSNHFALPLAEQKALSVTDPSAFLTGNMTNLTQGEIIGYQLVITPVVPKMQKDVGRSIKKITKKINNGEPIERTLSHNFWQQMTEVEIISELWNLFKIECLMVALFFKGIVSVCEAVTKSSGSTVAIKSYMPFLPQMSVPYEEELHSVIKEKLSQPLFEVAARLVVVDEDESERKQKIQGLIATFAQMDSAYQSFITKGSFFLQRSTVKFRLQKFIQRRLSPGSPYNPNPIVSASEITDLFHFPYFATNKTEDLEKVLSPELPVPLLVKNTKDFAVTFAQNTYGNKMFPIGLTEDERTQHIFLLGQTGSGKSTVIFHSAKDDIQKGKGVCVIDPHGDLIEDLLTTIPEERLNDVVYFNPFDIKFPIRINLLELTQGLDNDQLELEKEAVCESVVSIFRRLFLKDDEANAHRIEQILRNAIYTAFYIKDPTIFTVYKLLTDEQYLKKILNNVTDETIQNYWRNEFAKAGNWQVFKLISPVTSRIDRFQFSPIARRIFEAPFSTIDFDRILDTNKIFLCNLAEGKVGEDTSRLIGTTIIAKIQLSILKRARMNITERAPFYLYIDEFQKYATAHFTSLLSGVRKFGLRVTIAEQSTAQQKDQKIVQVILANVGTVICFKTASTIDEELMLSEFSPQVKKGELKNLPRHHFYMKPGSLIPQEPFSGVTYPITIVKDDRKKERILNASRQNFASVYVHQQNVAHTMGKILPIKNDCIPKKPIPIVDISDLT